MKLKRFWQIKPLIHCKVHLLHYEFIDQEYPNLDRGLTDRIW